MMDLENEHDQVGEEAPPKRRSTSWRLVGQMVLALMAGGFGYIGGLLSGAGYGGNHAPDFFFLGSPGYEGSALMAGIISGGTLFVIAIVSLLLLRKLSVATLTMVGALVGIVVGAPLFFAVIAPSTWLLAAVYAGSAVVGAVVGLIIGSVASPRKPRA